MINGLFELIVNIIITTFFNGVEDFILFFILNQRQNIMNPLAWSSRVLWTHLINIYEKFIYIYIYIISLYLIGRK